MLSLGMLATRLIAVLTLALGLFGIGVRVGSSGVQAAWKAERNAQAVADARRAVRLADAGMALVDNYTRSAVATATRTQKFTEAGEQFRLPARYRTVGGLPCMEPWVVH